MKVNAAAIGAIFMSMSTVFNKTFAEVQTTYQKIAMTVPSSSAYVDYRWLANFPQMKRWVGNKQVTKLSDYKYTIVNEDFQATVEVRRNDIEDDQLGIYKPQAESAAWSAKQLPDELIYELVNKSFTEKCYDGKAFIADNHPVGKAAVSNKGKKKLSIESLAKAQASFGAARIAMMQFKDDEGRPLNVKPNILLVPVALGDTARALMTVDRLEDGKPNPYKGVCEVVEEPRLTDDNAWFLLDCNKPVKPFVFQERKKPVFVQQTNMDSDDVFNRAVYKFGAEARGAAGFGHWQLAYGSDGTEV
ncbi:head protein [Acinetobacter ursingii]|uniref:Mu-like prophage major head subunit gpT family protein n=1 Tax=Acinetobacter ursingii TaxID=108980 RepID=UPI000F76A0FF|nr:Mu-like prophage major head subunit gpT family protein [Acinetobacter ursingii]RSO80421.1 head protein [Acinetobacter ursingii]